MQDNQGVPASPSGLRPFGVEPPSSSQAEPLVPNAEKCGKYGLPPLDGYAIDVLANAISAQGAGNITIAKQQDMLRHALAAFMIRCQVGGEWKDGEK